MIWIDAYQNEVTLSFMKYLQSRFRKINKSKANMIWIDVYQNECIVGYEIPYKQIS